MEKPLSNITVIDCAQLYAGPLAAMYMGDFGADVIKVEHPNGGDTLRGFGGFEEPLSWKWTGRNKQSVPIDLHAEEGKELFKALVAEADILIESFRPGTLERWDVGWETLSAVNEDLVMVRTTGFGQGTKYSHKAGFGTLAEAMSGFAYVTGPPDRPPTLPGMALADAVAACYSTFAAMFALYWRDVEGGTGQYIDTSLLEPLFGIMGENPVAHSVKGVVQERSGNRNPHSAPRNTYKTKDDRWVAISASAESVAKRVLELVGGEELVEDSRFATMEDRIANVEELDALIQAWMDERTRAEAIEAFDDAGAAIAPIYNIADIFADEYFWNRDALITVEDDDLGEIDMAGVFPHLSKTPGDVRHTGPALGEHTVAVLSSVAGLGEDEIMALADRGIVAVSDD